MKNIVNRTICTSVLCALISWAMVTETRADGTEELGIPSIPIASGSEVVVEGVGLNDGQPGDIHVEIPAGVEIKQVLLYWAGRADTNNPAGASDTIQVNGEDVTGPRIGGPTPPPVMLYPSSTYRADITGISSNMNWVVAGQTNTLSVGGLGFAYHNSGAAVVVIFDDGSSTDIQIRDGNDFAYLPIGMQTEAVTFPIVPSSDPRVGYVWLIVTDVEIPRPAAVDVTVGGTTFRVDDLQNNEGDFLDVVGLEVPVPPGATNVTLQVLSIDDESGLVPASLSWNFVSWELPEAPMNGCTYTIGYWKNHPEDWPTDTLSLYSGEEAMEILWSPSKGGNAYLILAHQYIGAELNVVNGTDIPDNVLDAWGDAQLILDAYKDEGKIPKNDPVRDMAIALAGTLDAYNNGFIGPGHCD